MQPVPQDLLKEYVQSQHFSSTADIMQATKEMFRDVIQQVMEVEMDEELGRERCQRSEEPKVRPGTTAMVIPRRASRHNWARSTSRYPGTAMGRLNPRSSASTIGMHLAWRERSCRCTPAA